MEYVIMNVNFLERKQKSKTDWLDSEGRKFLLYTWKGNMKELKRFLCHEI